jgi:hypothetical protein
VHQIVALLAVMRQAMNSDAGRKPEEARPREPAGPPDDAQVRKDLVDKNLADKIRADEEVWLRVIEAQRKAPEPTLEETLAAIRQTIAEDGI